MASNLAIDMKLLTEAQRLFGIKTKRETVNFALEELIAARKRQSFIQLMGTMDWDKSFDIKAERSRV